MPRPRLTLYDAKVAIDHSLAWLLDRTVRICARPFLRTVLGSWPSRADIAEFRTAHRDGGHLPRPLHALSTIGNARRMLTAAALEAWLPGPVYGAADALVLSRRPRLAFMHLEKTGGTSVEEFLLQQYHPVQVVTHPRHGDTPPHALMRDNDARQRALIYGHYSLPFLQAFDPQRQIFTVLREPRARILSMYYYWRSSRNQDGSEPNTAALLASHLPLLEFLKSGLPEVRNSIANFYARRLTGLMVTPDGDPFEDDPTHASRLALDALKAFGFVGITEHLEDSLRLLATRWAFIPAPMTPRTNVGDQIPRLLPAGFAPVAREPITPQIDHELMRLTGVDALIYQTALQTFHALHSGSTPPLA